jgi:hypothetical protein
LCLRVLYLLYLFVVVIVLGAHIVLTLDYLVFHLSGYKSIY